MALPDGSTVRVGGFEAGVPIRFFLAENRQPWLDIPGVERVRWLAGPAGWPGPGGGPGATPSANV